MRRAETAGGLEQPVSGEPAFGVVGQFEDYESVGGPRADPPGLTLAPFRDSSRRGFGAVGGPPSATLMGKGSAQ